MYISLPERNEVDQIGRDGSITPLPRPADRSGRTGLPTGLVVGPDNVLYIAEGAGGTVTRQQLAASP